MLQSRILGNSWRTQKDLRFGDVYFTNIFTAYYIQKLVLMWAGKISKEKPISKT